MLPALLAAPPGSAQFYSGSRQEYGKNRVQYQEFLWQQYRFDDIEVYFYKEGRDLARYTAQSALRQLKELEQAFDFPLDERLQFIVYNSLTDFRQSNIGLAGIEGDNNIGGMTRIVGTKIFVYFEGDHVLLDRQVRSGIAHVIIDQMMFGGNWREMLRSATFMSLPAWFTDGIISYHGQPWDAHLNSRVRDGVLSGRFDRFNRLEGEDARLAGHALWAYVADVYGAGVIPNILYMTRVSRNSENGFLYVLGISLKSLQRECLLHYRQRFADEDRLRQDPALEPLPIRTRRQRTYASFRMSPDGRWLAWTSNEQGQWKVWVHEVATGRTRRIAKGEKKLNRIVDRSFPMLAWHPSGRALSYTVERRGRLWLRTHTLDDGKTLEKPIFMLQKVLSLDYAPDGRTMVFSAVRDGRTDLYLYHVIGNRQDQLTNDQFDDLHPRFTDGGRRIIFSSDRPDDTLRTHSDVALVNGRKDIYLLDLERRTPLLTRLTDTPGADETHPAQVGNFLYTYLSDEGGIHNRHRVRYDSTVSHIDTAVHYRYFTVQERLTDLKRSLLEQDVPVGGNRYTALQYANGRYHFFLGPRADDATGALPDDDTDRDAAAGVIVDDTGPVVKVDPQFPRAAGGSAVDPRNYTFLDDAPKARGTMEPGPDRPPADAGQPAAADTLAQRDPFTYPEQRNYNTNFTVDQVVTQVDNSFSSLFYQPFTGPTSLNPGLSALTRMSISDLFEDHRIVGGFRLALDLSNNDYLLSYENVKRRLDKRITVQRQAYQGVTPNSVVKVHTHHVRYQVSWPFNELASLRGSAMYRNDRFVLQSIDPMSLVAPNFNDNMVGLKAEFVYDSSVPRGLNLWTGWKLKFFAEHYQQPDEGRSDMQTIGMDLRHSLKVHREMLLVTRLAHNRSLGSRRIVHFLGGVDNWMFAQVDASIPIDPTQNYFYQTMAVPMRGFFYNARNGTSFAVLNNELRLPLFRYLINRPIRSDFINHFQVAAFADIGSAWTGLHPYSADNSFNRITIVRNPLIITLDNRREPVVGGYGFGLRSRLLGYFVRCDWAWGVDDGVVMPRVFYFSLSLDI